MAQLPIEDAKEAAYEQFLDAYPGYRRTAVLDEVRARDFARLDEQRQVYLDYTGAGLYATVTDSAAQRSARHRHLR